MFARAWAPFHAPQHWGLARHHCLHDVQIKRIGKYKSAGDQLLRTDMSEAQKEQLDALLDGLYGSFLTGVAQVCTPVVSLILRLEHDHWDPAAKACLRCHT